MTKTSTAFHLPVIIFDWDDTLLDAGQLLSQTQAQAIDDILKEKVLYPFSASWQAPSQEMLFQHAGHRFKEKILPRIMPQVDCENPAHQQWMDDTYLRFKKYYQQAQKKLFPGVVDMLKALKQAGYTLCIASNKSRDLLEDELRATSIEGLFTHVMAGDDSVLNKNVKPAPHMINQIQAEFMPDTLFVMVGDRPYDVQAARASQAKSQTHTIGILTKKSFTLDADIEITEAAHITDQLISTLVHKKTHA